MTRSQRSSASSPTEGRAAKVRWTGEKRRNTERGETEVRLIFLEPRHNYTDIQLLLRCLPYSSAPHGESSTERLLLPLLHCVRLCACVHARVCVCERERARERGAKGPLRHRHSQHEHTQTLSLSLSLSLSLALSLSVSSVPRIKFQLNFK